MKTVTKSLLDPTFAYRNAANTDVRITFERVRREREALRQCERESAKVVAIVGKPSDSPESNSLTRGMQRQISWASERPDAVSTPAA